MGLEVEQFLEDHEYWKEPKNDMGGIDKESKIVHTFVCNIVITKSYRSPDLILLVGWGVEDLLPRMRG